MISRSFMLSIIVILNLFGKKKESHLESVGLSLVFSHTTPLSDFGINY